MIKKKTLPMLVTLITTAFKLMMITKGMQINRF